MLKTPIIIINFKTYIEGSGQNALRLARICDKISRDKKLSIAIALQPFDIYMVSKEVSIPVLAQHLDNIDPGRNTGFLLPESAKMSGAVGSLLNHSEHTLEIELIRKTIIRLKSLNLVTVVCANDINNAKEIAKFNPNFIAIEPPELIGGKISVSRAKPDLIRDSVLSIKKINKEIKVLCGAGIQDDNDVRIALKLGTCGVLVSSSIVLAKNQERELNQLVKGVVNELLINKK